MHGNRNRIIEVEYLRKTVFAQEMSERKRGTPSNKGAFVAGLSLTLNKSWWVTIFGRIRTITGCVLAFSYLDCNPTTLLKVLCK